MPDNTTMILSARGAFYQVSLADAAAAAVSFYGVEFLTLNPDEKSPASPILIDGVRTRESDIVSRTPCLNNFKVYYSFGQNFGDISITGVVLLGPMGDVSSDGVNRLRDWFAKYRVSAFQKSIKVNLIDKAYSMFLEGMQIMEVDKEFHILPFALFGTQFDISRTAPPSFNPVTVVLSEANLDDSSLAAALAVVNPSIAATPVAQPTAASNAADNAAAATTQTSVFGPAITPEQRAALTTLSTPAPPIPPDGWGAAGPPTPAGLAFAKSIGFGQAPYPQTTPPIAPGAPGSPQDTAAKAFGRSIGLGQ